MARVKRYKLDESPYFVAVECQLEYSIRFYFSTATGCARFKNQILDYAEQVSGVLLRRYRGLLFNGMLIAAFDLYFRIERADQRVVLIYPDGTVRTLENGTLVKMRCWYTRSVVTAHWVSIPHKRARICSRCGCEVPYKFADECAEVYNFCPNCGADMRKE